MGRMSDARKRAKERKPSPPPAEPPEVQPAEEPEVALEPAREEKVWVARDEPMVFPADPAPEPGTTRIALPSSGLAEEILLRADAAAVVSQPALEPAAEPAPQPTRAQNLSFFGAPSREAKAVEASEHLATFFLGSEEYGVDVRLVQEIIRVTEITHVPRAPGFIRGVINLRGRIIPVVDLKRKLALGEVLDSRQARIVVVKVRDRLIGLLADGASQVLKVPLASIEAAPEEVVEIDLNYIRGVAKLEKRLIILLDLARVLAVELKEVAQG